MVRRWEARGAIVRAVLQHVEFIPCGPGTPRRGDDVLAGVASGAVVA